MPKDIWISEKWMKNPDIYHSGRRTGLRMRYDKEVDPEVKAAFQELVDWIRARFYFPVRVTVYIKASEHVTASDGDLCVSVSFLPYSYLDEPHSKIATGDYDELVSKRGILQAKIAILLPLFFELTHYYQWVNDEKLTSIGEKRQASRYAQDLMEEYLDDLGLIDQL